MRSGCSNRCYANPPGVESIHDRGAHIVVRYNRGTLPVLRQQGQRIDVMALLNAHLRSARRSSSSAPRVHVGEKKIVGRLCWIRLPADKALEARHRAAKESDGPCDVDTLFAASSCSSSRQF